MNSAISQLIQSLQTKMSELNFTNWIKPVRFHLLPENHLQIEIPNRFIRDWITENYLNLIRYELFKITGFEHTVKFEIRVDENLPLSSVPSEEEERPQTSSFIKKIHPFNGKYTFESFVVGTSNQFAHAAARAVGESPAKTYNPLFLYGGVGLGKTHLLSAIGQRALEKNPNFRIIYITGEQFTNELINAIRYEKMFDFRKKFRDGCDLLLVDDIQFIAGKERTQEEFFHTFNFLYESRKQVVLTSDAPPKEILQLEERLRSRFEWGLIADIQPPDTETRIAILKKKAEQDHISISDEVALFLASNIRSNVRELEGSLIRIHAFSSLVGAEITVDLIREVLKNSLTSSSPVLTIEKIQKQVASHYNIQLSELKSARRLKVLVGPRQVAMYLCRKHVKSSFPELGLKFGGKDHSTIVHAVQKIGKQLEQDPQLKQEINQIEKALL